MDIPIEPRWDGPHFGKDFPDPSIIKDKKDGKWKAYATSSNNAGHIPMAESSNGVNWSYLNKDALPDVGPWVDPKDRGIWAPDVFRDDKGNYVMYCKSHQLSLPVLGSLTSTTPNCSITRLSSDMASRSGQLLISRYYSCGQEERR